MDKVAGDTYPPISDYGLIDDCHGAALVSRDGSIDWCCFHRFDARPVFARILDWSKGGHYRIAPTDDYSTSRRYLDATNIIETTFTTKTGSAAVIDCMPMALQGHPYHELVRVVRGLAGEVEMALEFEPRFDYGLSVPKLKLLSDSGGIVYGGADALAFHAPVPVEQTDKGSCHTVFTVGEGDEFTFCLGYDLPHEATFDALDLKEVRSRLEDTITFWREWAAKCTYDGPHKELVVRSSLVLKALTNSPTGAMVAAPTTSLPEDIGGVRNWDYRYTWLRDAAFTLYALFVLGYRDEAHAFTQWLIRTTVGRAEDIQILYGVGGERLLPEIELTHLEGYRGSAPVRIGNGAVSQFQLDVYGEILDTLHLYRKHGGEIDDDTWELCCALADFVAEHWREPDYGIWEVRSGPSQFVHSKALCWVALDRAARIAEATERGGGIERWCHERDEIKRLVFDDGFDEEQGSFVQSLGSSVLDAASLLLPLVRFIKPDDPRMTGTVDAIQRNLTKEGLVYRYLTEDGLSGGEGTFAICSFWLVDNLLMQGRVDDGRALFEHLVGYANDLGLFAEEVDPHTGEQLGNFPQAFTHVALINSAVNLAQADARGACETCRG